ncbi:MAG: DegT/DnrJ/EryC1/StrS family aminotransferase, partial [Acidobacteriaceae bacterium]
NAIRMVGAMPVFVDIDSISLNMNPENVAAAITPRTRAILVVHTFGRPAAMTELLEISRRHGLVVIEDACEAIGAEYRGQKVGILGDAGVFAFYPNKQMTTGEGGMIVTNQPHIAETARSLRNQGRTDCGEWLDHAVTGYNYRLPEMSCALGRTQLQRLESILQRRAEVAACYNAGLRGNCELILPALEIPDGRLSWFVYVVRLSKRFLLEERDAILRRLAEQGIGCGRYFAPIHMQPAYRDLPPPKDRLSITEEVGQRSIALPFFNRISFADVQEVCCSLQDAMRAVSLH